VIPVILAQIGLPFVVAALLVLVPAQQSRFFRRITLGTISLVFIMGFIPTSEGAFWPTLLDQENIQGHLFWGTHGIPLTVNAVSAGLILTLLVMIFTVIAVHPFHTQSKTKPFVIISLLLLTLLQACFIIDSKQLSFTFAVATHGLFWILMTQMGTGRRSLIALRVFTLMIVFDSISLACFLAPISILNSMAPPWTIGLIFFLAAWVRFGIFPFHSIHRWVAQSISPSVALLFILCQVLIGAHFCPTEALSVSVIAPTRNILVELLFVHFLWLGFLSVGERRPMMILTHAILLLTGLNLILFDAIQLPFSLRGPWPWAMALFAVLGLFVDELHNLKNDILATFEHAQVGLLKRWPQMRAFAQTLIFVFSFMLILFPIWALAMPENQMLLLQKLQNQISVFIALAIAFTFALLATHLALFQLWRRWNTSSPVERVVLPEGATPPVVWRWHLSGALAVAFFSFGFFIHFS